MTEDYLLDIKIPRSILNPNMTIKSITINENKNKIDSMIEILFRDDEIFYIPHGFYGVYTQIIKFTVVRSKLKEIHQSDFSQFPELKILWLYDNDLEILENNLFEKNLKLEEIEFQNNKIWFIGDETFTKLSTSILKLNFSNNFCINLDFNSGSESWISIIENLKNCAENKILNFVKVKLENQILSLKKENLEKFDQIQESLEKLSLKIESVSEVSSNDHESIEKVESTVKNINDKIKKVKNHDEFLWTESSVIFISLFVLSVFISFILMIFIHFRNKKKYLKLQDEVEQLENLSYAVRNYRNNQMTNRRRNNSIPVVSYERPNFDNNVIYEELIDVNRS